MKVPGAAIVVHPQMLEAYKETATGTREQLYELTADHIRHTATNIARLLQGSQGRPWTAEQYKQVREQLERCHDDTQRRLVLDWLAYVQTEENPH